MKNLKLISRLKKNFVKANTNDNVFLSEEDLLIQKMQSRIDFLQNWLDDVLVRDESKRNSDVIDILNQMTKIQPSMVTYYILDNYGHNYFTKEVDTYFKIQLAKNILDYVRTIYPNYKNELLEGISNNNSKYTLNYIYVENV